MFAGRSALMLVERYVSVVLTGRKKKMTPWSGKNNRPLLPFVGNESIGAWPLVEELSGGAMVTAEMPLFLVVYNTFLR